jgi:hypothetical protein
MNRYEIQLLTDSSNPPTIVRHNINLTMGNETDYYHLPISPAPIKKDDYWKIRAIRDPEETEVSISATVIYWLPIGSGGCVLQ